MKKLLILMLSLSLVLLPIGIPMYTASAQQVTTTAVEQATHPPPVAQPLVREGDFAVRLVSALNLGQTSNEAEAESILSSAGIAPTNGWIADYPVTPEVVAELHQSIEAAASSGRIAMSDAAAVNAFYGVSEGLGLAISPAPGDAQAATTTAPPPDNTLYTSPTTVNNYYYRYGPPVVTYYAPPPAYAYLYYWVPYPFFSLGFWFPGYYCLHDFDRVIFTAGVYRVCTNHWYDPHLRSYVLVRPSYWYGHGRYHHSRYIEVGRGFEDHHQWNRHAEAIYRGNRMRGESHRGEMHRGEMHRGVRGPERFGPHHTEVARGGSTPHFRGPEGRSGHARSPSRVGAAHTRSYSPGHLRSFHSERSFNRPSGSQHGSFHRGGLTSGHARSFTSERQSGARAFSVNRSFGGTHFNKRPSFSAHRSFSGGHSNRPSYSAHRSFGGARFNRPSLSAHRSSGGPRFSRR